MKCFIVFIICGLLTTNCLAQDKAKAKNESVLSGEAQLWTHFIVKGLSYSDNNPALNAAFVANLHSQVKLGLWGSNISHVSATDDNLWLKFFSSISIDYSDRLSFTVFLADHHFYKSNERNGQSFGADFIFKSYAFGLELMNNYEGTRSPAEYLWFGKLFEYRYGLKWGGYAGMTMSQASAYQSFFDFKILGRYTINAISNVEAGATMNSNSAQFGIRDDPALYIALKLIY